MESVRLPAWKQALHEPFTYRVLPTVVTRFRQIGRSRHTWVLLLIEGIDTSGVED